MPWLKDNKGNRGRTHMVWEEENTGVEIKSGKWSEASFHSEEMLTGWDCVHQHYAFCELCMTGQKQLDCFILHQGALLSSCCSAVRELWSIVNLEVCVCFWAQLFFILSLLRAEFLGIVLWAHSHHFSILCTNPILFKHLLCYCCIALSSHT